MQVKSVQKFVRTSPRKLRLVADIARQLDPVEAIEALPHTQKRAVGPLIKVIKSAMANAKILGISEDRLFFEELQINEGPRLKRGRAASRGRWHPYKRRMSHIRVILGVKEEAKKPKSSPKKTTKSKSDSAKKQTIKPKKKETKK
ncbi:50S ribosomal protein L22 [Patescibacteria group bacterium]